MIDSTATQQEARLLVEDERHSVFVTGGRFSLVDRATSVQSEIDDPVVELRAILDGPTYYRLMLVL